MFFVYNDGGRSEAGYQGRTGDCVVRAIAIVTDQPYQVVYDAINDLAKKERISKRYPKKSSSRTGVYRKTYQKYLESMGWQWVAVQKVGVGCSMHLHPDELPEGKIIARVSKHLCAVIDGIVHDTHDCSRAGTRCVYGYFTKKDNES